jgi:hypothetical protein
MTKIRGIKDQLFMAHELIHCLNMAQDVRHLSEAKTSLRKRMNMRYLGLSSLERTMAR